MLEIEQPDLSRLFLPITIRPAGPFANGSTSKRVSIFWPLRTIASMIGTSVGPGQHNSCRSAMRFDQEGVICGLCDAGAKRWKYIAEQQSDQLLPGWGGPVLRDLCNERVGGGEHNARVTHPLTGKFFGMLAGGA